MAEPFLLNDGTELAKPTRVDHQHRWEWAREGRGSCAVIELRQNGRVFLTGGLRAAPNPPPEPGSFAEDATRRIMSEYLFSIVNHYLDQGYVLLALNADSAVLTEPGLATETV